MEQGDKKLRLSWRSFTPFFHFKCCYLWTIFLLRLLLLLLLLLLLMRPFLLAPDVIQGTLVSLRWAFHEWFFLLPPLPFHRNRLMTLLTPNPLNDIFETHLLFVTHFGFGNVFTFSIFVDLSGLEKPFRQLLSLSNFLIKRISFLFIFYKFAKWYCITLVWRI